MAVVQPRLLGAPIRRGEDPRLLTGQGAYLDDVAVPGLVHLAFARSPHAHARLPASLDLADVRAAPGVLAALSASDLEGAFAGPLHHEWDDKLQAAQRPPRLPLARGKVRYVGEPLVAVVAETQAQADDALDRLTIDYEPLPAVTEPEAALTPGAPLLYEEFGSNLAHRLVKEGGDVDAAFARSDVVVVRQRLINPRVLPTPLETRGATASFDRASGELTFWSSTQIPHTLRTKLAPVLGLAENRIRVIAPDVGGGFGAKIECSTEEVITAYLAMRLGRPIRWVETRRENFQAMIHGRGQVDTVEVAATRGGEIVGLKVHVLADLGAGYGYTTPVIAPLTSLVLPGPYRTPAVRFELQGVFTNKTPVGAYRGAGRPEATYLLERTVDLVARTLDLDPAEVRRRNFISSDAFPYTTPLEQTYDSGDYGQALNRLLALADYDGLRIEQAAARQDASRPLLGIGLSAYVEICAFGPWESATVRVDAGGGVTVLAGTSPHGQGHTTPFKQIVADQLGVPLDSIAVRFNDTASVPTGSGTYGSRSAAVGGTAVLGAAERVRTKVVRIAAELLEAAIEDIAIEPGRISVRGVPDRSTTLAGVADRAYSDKLPDSLEPGLEASRFFKPPGETFSFGVHLAVVEIDRETGKVRLVRYLAVDDCGRVLNPLLVDGQRHGGIAQGVGQALLEEVLYDVSGQLETGTLGDYPLPRAGDFPVFELNRTETPTPRNPLGVKGIGEAGTIGSTPAIANAVIDALAPFGVTHLDMPTTPERIWRTLHRT
jgi:carbon-monoxide dehydrogenase large subunit